MRPPFQKGVVGMGVERGVAICRKTVLCRKHTSYSVSPANTAIAEKGCKWHKNREFTKTSAVLFKLCKECVFGWLLCCMLCVELCGVSLLLCAFLVLVVLCFSFGVFGTVAIVLECLSFFPVLFGLFGRFCSYVWVWKMQGEVGPFPFLVFFLLSFCLLLFLFFAVHFSKFQAFFFGRFWVKRGPEGPPHLTLNLPGFFIFLFVLCSLFFSLDPKPSPVSLCVCFFLSLVCFGSFCLFALVLLFVLFFLRVGLCLLFWFLPVNKNAFPPAILVSCWCNVGSTHVFPIQLLNLVFVVFTVSFSFLFLKLECFLCCLFVKRNTIDPLLVLDLVFCFIFLLVYPFDVGCFFFPQEETNPQTLEFGKRTINAT